MLILMLGQLKLKNTFFSTILCTVLCAIAMQIANKLITSSIIYSRLSRCSTDRRSNTGLSVQFSSISLFRLKLSHTMYILNLSNVLRNPSNKINHCNFMLGCGRVPGKLISILLLYWLENTTVLLNDKSLGSAQNIFNATKFF